MKNFNYLGDDSYQKSLDYRSYCYHISTWGLIRLPTRDTLLSWDRRYHHVCPFYSLGHEFHTHLSFSGPFSTVIWSHFSSWMFSTPPDSLASVAHFIDQPHIVSCSCVALVIKLLMHAVIHSFTENRMNRKLSTMENRRKKRRNVLSFELASLTT
ncbi:hypothetical protein HID58_079744 [Brassica napus]|uniref:Uncharacterized protein n=1 Tax=Brassica napus TaxID=3708 RepID=A0ABQ7Y2W5_BRANA|nr:hypothetical protein HID58_079744 [Brassica napus]